MVVLSSDAAVARDRRRRGGCGFAKEGAMRWVILPLLVVGVAGCVQDQGYYDGPPSRGGYYDPPPRYYPQSRWDGGGDRCTFQTRRGPIAGYIPSGKNRCCIDTRDGQSCQRLG
jgi:hypothetical protein